MLYTVLYRRHTALSQLGCRLFATTKDQCVSSAFIYKRTELN
uniref:Uncharacterized protein n=1 Tax=Anguilla anguilla TaxID=7936 RepID=A0A0E9SAZ0_ANGAN